MILCHELPTVLTLLHETPQFPIASQRIFGFITDHFVPIAQPDGEFRRESNRVLRQCITYWLTVVILTIQLSTTRDDVRPHVFFWPDHIPPIISLHESILLRRATLDSAWLASSSNALSHGPDSKTTLKYRSYFFAAFLLNLRSSAAVPYTLDFRRIAESRATSFCGSCLFIQLAPSGIQR